MSVEKENGSLWLYFLLFQSFLSFGLLIYLNIYFLGGVLAVEFSFFPFGVTSDGLFPHISDFTGELLIL